MPRERRTNYDPTGTAVIWAVLRLAWPSLLLLLALVALLARRPGLLASRAFVPVLLVAGALLLVGYRRRRPPR